ncbi:MAG: tyrosine-type recombinase/integrase [Planctomycetota bacterium]
MGKRRPTPRGRRPLSWEQAIDVYERHLCLSNRAPLTVRAYHYEIKRLRSYLDTVGVDLLEDVCLDHLREYQAGLLSGTASRTGKPLTLWTVHRVSTTLSAFFELLVDEELLERSPARRLERPKLPVRPPGGALTTEQVVRLLSIPDLSLPTGLRDRALLEVYYATGLRRSEALALDLSDVDTAARELLVRSGKGGKSRVVPVTRSAWQQILAYLRRGRPALTSVHRDSARAVFLTSVGRRLGPATVFRSLRHYGAAAGLERLTPHMLRRTFATSLLRGGVTLRHIQLLLGHASLNTTAAYLCLDTGELRREILLKHPRERFSV